MAPHYVDTKNPRFVVESIDGSERIVIPAQRHLFITPFLVIWLCGWTFAGFSVLKSLTNTGFQPFLLIWMCAWVLGEAFALATLCWMFTGKEILRVVGSDLEIGYVLLGLATRKLYRGSEIRDLMSCETPALSFNRYSQLYPPFLTPNRIGSVRFTYGARSVYAGQGLDQAEGRQIVERLRKRLPSTVTASD
jgi:hypothetical protein